jgi:hypothetical protein
MARTLGLAVWALMEKQEKAKIAATARRFIGWLRRRME